MKYFMYILIAGGLYAHLDKNEKDMATLDKVQVAALWPGPAAQYAFKALKIYTEKNK